LKSTVPVITPVSVDTVGGIPIDKQRFPALVDAVDYTKNNGQSKSKASGASLPIKKHSRLQPIDENETPYSGAWLEGPVSKKLFPNAKATPIDEAWGLKIKNEENSNNILYHQFWNPDSKDYDAARFYHPILELYKCPIPACK
jgi:hypothetical protein